LVQSFERLVLLPRGLSSPRQAQAQVTTPLLLPSWRRGRRARPCRASDPRWRGVHTMALLVQLLLLLLSGEAVMALAAPVPPSANSPPPPPNILFLFADEMDGRIFDPASPQLKPPMPNLHRLSESGAVFPVAYNQSPQCVPSRSALLVGLRTDQIEVWDNYHGIAATDGDASRPDPHCVQATASASNMSLPQAHAYCVALAKAQRAPPTFIDRLASAGYHVELYGKMHAGGGLDRFPGQIGEFPFSWLGSAREWTRGLGPSLNLKGVSTADNSQTKWVVPDNVTQPASRQDYAAIDGCVKALEGGLFLHPSKPAFLYCSILPPHPVTPVSCPECGTTYPTNATYDSQSPRHHHHRDQHSAGSGLITESSLRPAIPRC
jgi:hypothetical protein